MIKRETFQAVFIQWAMQEGQRVPLGQHLMAVLLPYVHDKQVSEETDTDAAGKLFQSRYVT